MLDSLQGDLSMNVLVKVVDLPVWLDNRDLNAPVDLHFTDGKLDYKRLQSGLNKGVTMKMADEENEKSTGLGNYVAHALEFWMDDPKTLVLGLHLIDLPAGGPDDESGQTVPILKPLVRWNLESGEIADAAAGKLRLFRAIDPEKKKSSGGGGEGRCWSIRSNSATSWPTSRSSRRRRSRSNSPEPPVVGTIVFAPDAIVGLHVAGGVSGDVRPASRWGDPEPTGLSRGQPRRREHRVDIDRAPRRRCALDRVDHDLGAQERQGGVQPSDSVQLRRDHREGGREQHPVGCVN